MTSTGDTLTIRARYLASPGGPVIENAAVTVRDGRLLHVGPFSAAGGGVVDYEDAVLLPGFVNAHTHLELTGLAGRIPPGRSLADWLGRLVGELRGGLAGPEAMRNAVQPGIRMSLAAGVTTVGDISASPAVTRPILAASELAAVSFGEVIAIGRRRRMLDERLAAALGFASPRPDFVVGLSPHAPYTVEPAAMRHCAAAARAHRMPLCVHAAESTEEAEFTRHAAGPLADHLRALGLWDEGITPTGMGPIELIDAAGLLTPATVIAHANYASGADIGRLASSGASVAYCPRTHAAFGHQPHSFRALRAAGVNVCIGTDSLASNPDLSILGELRFLRARHPDVDAMTLLEMGTHCGAKALGLDGQVGRLAPGLRADIVVLPLEGGRKPRWDGVFESDSTPRAVCVAGRRLTSVEFEQGGSDT